MSTSIEAAGQSADGPGSYGLVYVYGVEYRPGQEVPVEDELGVVARDELAGGYTGIEIIRGAEQRFRSLGHGPIRSELDI